MAEMTISPRLMNRRGDCEVLAGRTPRPLWPAGARYASGAGDGPDPAEGGGRG